MYKKGSKEWEGIHGEVEGRRRFPSRGGLLTDVQLQPTHHISWPHHCTSNNVLPS